MPWYSKSQRSEPKLMPVEERIVIDRANDILRLQVEGFGSADDSNAARAMRLSRAQKSLRAAIAAAALRARDDQKHGGGTGP